jgi:uncharacterized membrane protein
MQWDLGFWGLATLGAMSVAFGVFTQLVFWKRASLWAGVVAAAAAFAAGVLISEGLFGWATEADLQPNIDGLSFDETLLGLVAGGLIVLAARYQMGRRPHLPVAG